MRRSRWLILLIATTLGAALAPPAVADGPGSGTPSPGIVLATKSGDPVVTGVGSPTQTLQPGLPAARPTGNEMQRQDGLIRLARSVPGDAKPIHGPVTASIRCVIREIKRALSNAVSALRGASSALDNSLEIVTGFPVSVVTISLALSSWALLRTAKREAMAKAVTCGDRRTISASSPASSNSCCASPL